MTNRTRARPLPALGAYLAVPLTALTALSFACGSRVPAPKGPGPEYEDPPAILPREAPPTAASADGGVPS